MTDNIQKLYEIAGVECKPNYVYNKVPILSGLTYPPFTAEKQLELIKWLAKRKDFGLSCYNRAWCCETEFSWEAYEYDCTHLEFEQALAGLIFKLYKYKKFLTDDQKQEIKRILE